MVHSEKKMSLQRILDINGRKYVRRSIDKLSTTIAAVASSKDATSWIYGVDNREIIKKMPHL